MNTSVNSAQLNVTPQQLAQQAAKTPSLPTLDYQAAIKSGVRPQAIQEYAKANNVQLTNTPQGGIGQDLAGAAGGTAGQFVAGPVGGAIGGGLGQGGGELVSELAQHQGLDWGHVLSQAGQGAIYGAIPGDPEASLGIKLLTRLGAGAISAGGAKAIENISNGKPIDENILNDMMVGGATNTILPSALEPISKFLFGDANKITSDIARTYVGEEASHNPEIVQHLDFGNPLQSRNNLTKAMSDTYQPLQAALQTKYGNVGDFLNNLTEGGTRADLPDRETMRVMDIVLNKLKANADSGKAIQGVQPNAQDVVGTPKLGEMVNYLSQLRNRMMSGKAGSQPLTASQAFQDTLEKMKQYEVPLSVINEIKKGIGQVVEDPRSSNYYQEAKNFIENGIGNDAATKQINQTYNTLKDSRDFVDKRFSDRTTPVHVERGMSLGDKIQLGLGGLFISRLLGLGNGFYNPISATMLATSAIKQGLTDTPEHAAAYANILAKKPITKMAQQTAQRVIQTVENQAQSQQ